MPSIRIIITIVANHIVVIFDGSHIAVLAHAAKIGFSSGL